MRVDVHRRAKNLVIGVFIFSLFFSFTNKVFLSVAFFMLVPLAFFFLPNLFRFKHHKCYVYMLLFFVLALISTFIYYPDAFLEYKFYRRDGNIIISYIPLFVLGLIPLKINFETILVPFLTIATGANFIGYLLLDGKLPSAHLLFVAHNAAGGYMAVILMVTLGMLLSSTKKNERRLLLILIVLQAFMLLKTDSRGSIIGVLLAIASYIWNRKFEALIMISSVVFMIGLLTYSYKVWQKIDGTSYYQAFALDSVDLEIHRGGTLILRIFFLWPRAVDNFLHSPLVGQGFSSYDDRPYFYGPSIMGMQFKINQYFAHRNSHAHNSFLNILSEMGLVGLLLFCSALYYQRNFIIKCIRHEGFKHGMFLAFWMIIYSSYTEHRIVTPSQMIPYTILLGLALSDYNYRKLRKPENQEEESDTDSKQ